MDVRERVLQTQKRSKYELITKSYPRYTENLKMLVCLSDAFRNFDTQVFIHSLKKSALSSSLIFLLNCKGYRHIVY
jgi:hypothetical protein